jgi:hypothetical protein
LIANTHTHGGLVWDQDPSAAFRLLDLPVTWQPVMLEWQHDWARRDTYDAVVAIVREHSGAYGMGVDYAYTMVHRTPQRTATQHEALPPVKA